MPLLVLLLLAVGWRPVEITLGPCAGKKRNLERRSKQSSRLSLSSRTRRRRMQRGTAKRSSAPARSSASVSRRDDQRKGPSAAVAPFLAARRRQRRTNVWRKVTSPAWGAKRLRSDNFSTDGWQRRTAALDYIRKNFCMGLPEPPPPPLPPKQAY